MKTKRNKIWLIIPVLVILGSIIKQLVVTFIPLGESIEVIPGVFNLGCAYDFVARYINLWCSSEAWARLCVMLFNLVILGLSLSASSKVKKLIASISAFLTLVALVGIYSYIPYENESLIIGGVVALGAIYFFVPTVLESRYIQLPWCIQLAGGLGNLIEMNIRGYVVDYLHFFPNTSMLIYNLEDWLIRLGNLAFIIGIMVFGVTMIVKLAIKATEGKRNFTLIRGLSK
jgi:lipoprotein signal peptidase